MPGGNHNYQRTQELKKFFREFYQPVVINYFDNITEENWNEQYADKGFTKAEAKKLFLIDPLKDSIPAMKERAELFNAWFKPTPMPAMYAVPVARFDSEQPTYKPQVCLKFEKAYPMQETDKDDAGLFDAELSFRLQWEESSVSEAKIKSLAAIVKSKFANPLFKWKKGTKYYRYADDDRKYTLSCFGDTKTDAANLFATVVSVQGDTYNPSFLKTTESDKIYSQNPGSEVVLGKPQKKLRRRPIGLVQFAWAQFSWHKLRHPIILVDTTYRWPDPLLRA
jgi:hypothetical protein